MVKDHSDSEKGNPLPPHRLPFPTSSEGSFICTNPPQYTSVGNTEYFSVVLFCFCFFCGFFFFFFFGGGGGGT